MSEEQFDRTLREALLAALQEDWTAELENIPETRLSLRQKRRMRRMLADPGAYYLRYIRPVRKRPEQQVSENGPVNFEDLRRRRHSLGRVAVVAILAAVLSVSALAYSLTGGQFFRDLFERESDGRTYADTEQLMRMGGGNVGAVVDTKDFSFVLTDAVSSGNSAMVAVKITAKNIKEFTQTQGENRRDYSFISMDGTLLGDNIFSYGWNYVFAADDPSLAANQCYLILSLTGREDIPAGTYTLELHDFGYLDTDRKETILTPGDWSLQVNLKDGAELSRTKTVNQTYTFGPDDYRLSDVTVNPLTITMNFTCDPNGDEKTCMNRLFDSFNDASIRLRDGTVVERNQFCCGGSGGGGHGHCEMTETLEFQMPLPAKDIVALDFGGQTLDLDWK